ERAGGSTGSFPVPSAIRSARRACSDVVGRSTSVGQETNLSTTGRRLSNSRRQSGQEAICASAAATSLAGETCRAYAQVVSVFPQRSDCLIPGECELCIPQLRQTRAFGLVRGGRAKKAPLRYARPHTPAGPAHKRPRYGRVRRPRRFNEEYLRCW